MPDVEFTDEESLLATPTASGKGGVPSGIMGLIIKMGLAKNAKGASSVLLLIAVLAAVAAVLVFLSGLP